MRDLTLAIPQGFSKRKTHTNASIGWINLTLIFSIIVLTFIYLFMVNNLSTKGYAIKELEKSLHQLESEQKRLQVQTSDLQSIDRLQLEAQKLNFVPATNVTYLKDSDYALK
ncbi:MAG: hypothetical protein A3B10_00535 [Candidatus Doudnabacteria bacterium RIFCSPLOWO2_01_FULL_44_21]|uniref:Cell division protein FtsL n=1 Tax=Candidatus Doudnabacteria bacterium RIFCSPLOWO2_01_FULL_44_21 TaxID=1817841 RepID=A0A1F5PXI1_9BACT|nr:MAG: hypothetical protein A3B95_01200 [Candidatus Doudnabacteria bacterium RIFCSPHIGHO2_02_FULL_43_13b]OGE94626.1 MAG: hypothetical protein A3B10_00535 [Candidatus Doudnabacteria bacterium RIFCSPLOWO2_01_FULL_44_21]